jgi:rhodanese-related sulfurtransferase
MSSWSDDPDVYKKRFNPETSQGSNATETTANSGGSYSMPVLENTTSNDDAEIVKAAALTVAPAYISASDLKMKIAEGGDMTIVSVRSAEHYAAGHIPGAINIGMKSIVDNLSQIDPDAPVYVYCYTGHSAAQTTALLQMLGYDAYSISFGMCGWTDDTSVNMDKCFKPDMAMGYDTE